MAKSGDSSNIDIFVRVKPVSKSSSRLATDLSENKLEFNIPRDAGAGFVNNQREHYEFRFNGILAQDAKQDEVFERVARNVVSGAMEGYNGTIFAYGQTGSGKTFTITGGSDGYVNRGIIPRTISNIFSEVSKRSDYQYTVHISYLEIYNENGYDLLDSDRDIKAMEDLRQIAVGEAEDGTVAFRNLSLFRANTEEEALNLLFQGDINRTISETPMNLASSRSHCIFTIHVEARKSGEDVVRRSKLNLVDLAGSERVAKTGVDGTTLREAKFINLSLHYLEQVIVALQERSMGLARPHIPYRNSMMTMALKDSLGGNCRTVMVATVSPAADQLDESISTCRFAQRVAMVRNKVELNEEMDPSLVIRRLKQEIRDLREEVKLLNGAEEERGPLTPDELQRLQGQVEAYVADNSSEAALNFGGSMMFIRAAFETFKRLLRSGGFKLGGGGASSAPTPRTPGGADATDKGGGPGGGGSGSDGSAGTSDELQEHIRKLKLQVAQRDNEINILVGMLKRREGGKGGPMLQSTVGLPAVGQQATAAVPAGGAAESPQAQAHHGGMGRPAGAVPGSEVASTSGAGAGGGGGGSDEAALLLNTNLLADRNKAFELFRKSYRQNEAIEENKALLKAKYDAAKGLGASVNDSKGRINDLRAAIEQRRMQRAAAAVSSGMPEPAAEDDPQEAAYKDQIEQEKTRYKDAFGQLRDLKKEIEHLHLLLEQSRTRLQRDFDQWMVLMNRQAVTQQQQQSPGARPSPGGGGMVPHGFPAAGGAAPSAPRQAWGEASPQQHAAAASASASPLAHGSGPGRSPSPGPGPGSGSSGKWATPVAPGSQMYGGGSPGQAYGHGDGYGHARPSYAASSSSPSHSSFPERSPHTPPHPQQYQQRSPGPGSGSGVAAVVSVSGGGQGQGAVGPRYGWLAGVDPGVLEAARPYLTGNADADADIVKFYEAKAKLLQKLGQ